MSTTLDGQELFDEQELKIELSSAIRGSIEKTVPGLDGILSIDTGNRGRKIKQGGVLRAKSQSQMNSRIDAISDYMDGNTHTIMTSDGREYDNIRMDSFSVTKEQVSGGGFCCDYEIVYTQLVV